MEEKISLPIKTKIAGWWIFIHFLLSLFYFIATRKSVKISPEKIIIKNQAVVIWFILNLILAGFVILLLKGRKKSWRWVVICLFLLICLLIFFRFFYYYVACIVCEQEMALLTIWDYSLIFHILQLSLLLVDRKNFFKVAK